MPTKTLIKLFLIYFLVKLLWFFFQNNPLNNHFKLEFLDVGQGDSILITTPNNKKILVDGGKGYDVDYRLDRRLFFPFCHFDMVVVTHVDADHIEGLTRVLERCSAEVVTFNDVDCTANVCEKLKYLITKFNVKEVSANDEFTIDNVYIRVLWPSNGFWNIVSSSTNNGSIVLFVSYHDFEALLTGDAEKEALSRVDYKSFSSKVKGPLEVYKASHHGSFNGLYPPFFSLFNVTNCVISVGENNFGHPSKAALDLFSGNNCHILRTDELGDVRFDVW
jgi:competence protein ComEC